MPDRIKAGIILPVIRKETLMRQKCFMGVFSNLCFFHLRRFGKTPYGRVRLRREGADQSCCPSLPFPR